MCLVGEEHGIGGGHQHQMKMYWVQVAEDIFYHLSRSLVSLTPTMSKRKREKML